MTAPSYRSGGAGVPTTHPHDDPPKHRCGKCNNGSGVYNPDCPNNTNQNRSE